MPTHHSVNVAFFLNRLVSSDPVEDETGELKSKGDQEFRQLSELNKLRVTWNTERRCYVDGSGLRRYLFLSNAMSGSYRKCFVMPCFGAKLSRTHLKRASVVDSSRFLCRRYELSLFTRITEV
jgi:hypothetical protein